MNQVVLIALRRPLTFVVLAILILLFGVSAILKTPTDIFPPIKIPVVAAVWTYTGLVPQDMSGRVIYYYERQLTTTVSGIERIESQSYYGFGVVKIYFQTGTDVAAAQAQVTAVSQTVIKQMPAGITPPDILVYDASSVPVLDLQVSAENLTPTEIYNLASNFIRPALISVAGVAIPAPYGGQQEDVEVDLDQAKMLAHGLTATDVGNALAKQNVVLPAGDQKIGMIDYLVVTNSTPVNIDTFNNMPIKQVGNAVVYLRDVAFVHRGGPPQLNIVVVKTHQAVLIEILKSGDASTLSVVSGVLAKIPGILKTLPPGVKITPLNNASVFVKASIEDVVQEMVTAACLAGLAVLIFVGSWRSTLIVASSIPLAILSSLIGLSWVGQSINTMTLGGLALAVGILVDDATVMIENINTHLEEAERTGATVDLKQAIIDAANQIVVPTFVSSTCICIVWLPLLQLGGIAGYLFLPLAEAVIFAMIASFILSRTLVPTLADWLLQAQIQPKDDKAKQKKPGIFARFNKGFNDRFERFTSGYRDLLATLAVRRKIFVPVYLLAAFASLGLLAFIGQDFFPSIKSGSIAMHARFTAGTRIEESASLAVLLDQEIHRLLPDKVKDILSNCGLPISGINMAYNDTGTIGSQDCDLTISLHDSAAPTKEYQQVLRMGLAKHFPQAEISFLPGNLTAKILDFGLPSPINIEISGRNLEDNFEFATKLMARIKHVAGAVDVRIQQIMGQPTLSVAGRRSYALGTGLVAKNIADNLLTTLSGSGQTAPTYWLDTKTGVSHLVNIQTPQNQIDTMNQLQIVPVDKGQGDPDNKKPQLIGALATISEMGTPGVVSHADIIPVINVYANIHGRDLGGVTRAIQSIIDEMKPQLKNGATIHLRGQSDTMTKAYKQLLIGLGASIVLIFLVIVVNFQSWLDPFIIITALPAALAGATWALFGTGTTLSVPALTGAIMCMGTATANTILVVDFARVELAKHGDPVKAAVDAGYARIRPVLMTALAMIIGMIPMATSNTQNFPLGRAVIGGLLVATVTTLLFVPCVFCLLHRAEPKQSTEETHSHSEAPA